jgi:peptide deformylase
MAKLKIQIYGDAVLRQPTTPVLKMSVKIQKTVQDMFDTLHAFHCCGLAAPQVGVSKQIFVLDCATDTQRYGQMVFINPKIVRKSGACLSQEGSPSFLGALLEVKRYNTITIRFQDMQARNQEMTVCADEHPLLCRAIQHEMDHLNGILICDRVVDVEATNALLKEKNLPLIDPNRLVVDAVLDEAFAQLEDPVALVE